MMHSRSTKPVLTAKATWQQAVALSELPDLEEPGGVTQAALEPLSCSGQKARGFPSPLPLERKPEGS
eukprot:565475-Rhodomonas_salina.1